MKDTLGQGLLTWVAAGLTAIVALVVLSFALLSPRTDSSVINPPTSFTPPVTATAAAPRVTASVETAPVPDSSDAADDAAIWIHPTDTSLSTVLGTDKLPGGGLGVYDLSGRELFFYSDGAVNNVDLRYNFPLGANRVSLVGVTKRAQPASLIFYRVNPEDRSLEKVKEVLLGASGIERPRGFAMYHSPVSGKYYAFVTDLGTNTVSQFELDGASGSLTATLVRSFNLGTTIEGLTADDGLQRLYVSAEEVGVWRYGAEPGQGEVRTLVDGVTSSGGHLTPSIKGLAAYYKGDGDGYLVVSSEGANNFAVYTRRDNAFLGTFAVLSEEGVDAVSGQDGIALTNVALGDNFPGGLFATQDHVNSDGGNGNSGNQNYKLVPWERIAVAFDPPLSIDTSIDPRLMEAPGTP